MGQEKEVERLSADDLLYLQETVAEVQSLQSSANTLLQFCQGRLAKKYSLGEGCGMDQKTGIITRPKPQMVGNDKTKENTDQPIKES